MKRLILIGLAVAVILPITVLASFAQTATTDQEDFRSQLISLELKDTPIRFAIENLFRGTGINYSLDASVSGNINSVSLRSTLRYSVENSSSLC